MQSLNQVTLKEMTQWAHQTLLSLGHTPRDSKPETIQNTPWSYVMRFDTSHGHIYLKKTPKQLALEPTITRILHDKFQAPVPEIIATNEVLDCFLMKDAGNSLRGILKIKFDINHLVTSINQFTTLQLSVANHIADFLNIGTPDWRLDQLPHLFKQLLMKEKLLIKDGLSQKEINTLKKHQKIITHLCDHLSHHNIKQTLVQCDFHDNNIVIDKSNNLSFIDLGEIVISHPFFSLIGFLHQVKKHHGLTSSDTEYLLLIDTCYKNYKNVASKKEFFHAFEIAEKLWIIYEVLAQHRLMLACGTDTIMHFQHGKMTNALKKLITICNQLNSQPNNGRLK